ncbi:hypothetical protein SAMN05216436_108115 [bacterium A37T11]|nr:hypothetical protein SAMN05216436_108115 [bacterium A37T11]
MAKNLLLWLPVLIVFLGAGVGFHRRAIIVETRYFLSQQRQTLRKIYLAEVGVREKTGLNDGPQVEKYLKAVGQETGKSWCAAFVCWTLTEAGLKNPKNGWAPALFPIKRILWERGKWTDVINHISTGDVFGIYFPKLKRIAHCGFVDKWGDKMVITVEGNTVPDGTVNARDGPQEGVHRKRRQTRSIYCVANWVSP